MNNRNKTRFERDYSPSRLALGVFALGRAADVYTTYVGLSSGFEETHPFSRMAIDQFGLDVGLLCVNLTALGTSYFLSKGFNRCFRSNLTDKVGDAVFLYGGAVASFAVALSNYLHISGYFS